MQEYESEESALKAAQHVLVVGGGATGVEFAAEIVACHPGKKVQRFFAQYVVEGCQKRSPMQ